MSAPRALPPTPIITSLHSPPLTGTQSGFPLDRGSHADAGLRECVHADVDDVNSPATLVPCSEHPISQRRTIFRFKKFVSGFQRAVDPYDYENKHHPDAEYQETGPTARVWKTAYDEATIVDANRVTVLTDALDVLLVFAGLFSGVVSAFVTQTYQSLQVDNTQIIASMMFELLSMQRAVYDGLPPADVPRTTFTPEMSFSPSSSAVWVNGLWFLSLCLSLTTALIAVVTKQWIHHYTASVQSAGTPRDSCRIREMRLQNFEEWSVAGIIGALPVLMHIALGLFFAGMIIFIRDLSTPISCIVGSVVAAALVAYFLSNALPVFKATCPYITPLTHFAYTLWYHLNCVLRVTIPNLVPRLMRSRLFSKMKVYRSKNPWSPPKNILPSFNDIEIERIERQGPMLDAHTLSRLYCSSSNTSIQEIVLQAISNLSIGVLRVVEKCITEPDLNYLLLSKDYRAPERQPARERLTRTLIRLFPGTTLGTNEVDPGYRIPESISLLLDTDEPIPAADLLSREILGTSARSYDPIVWLHVLQNAFLSGPVWLGYEPDNESAVWREFISCLIQPHKCPECVEHAGFPSMVYPSLPLTMDEPCGDVDEYYGRHKITLLVSAGADAHCTDAQSFKKFVGTYMSPSLSELALYLAYRPFRSEKVYKRIPADICLCFALAQTSWVQQTSLPADRGNTLMSNVIGQIRESVGLEKRSGGAPKCPTDAYVQHGDLLSATYHFVTTMISSASFPTLSLSDQRQLMHVIFRLLLLDDRFRSGYRQWMNDSIADMILEVLFSDPKCLRGAGPLLSDVLESVVRVQCAKMLPKLYERLCRSDWLRILDLHHFGGKDYIESPVRIRSHAFLTAAFLDGLSILASEHSTTHTLSMTYIRRPVNFLAMSKVLLLADIERQSRLDLLIHLLDNWSTCMPTLLRFLLSKEARAIYMSQTFNHPDARAPPLTYNQFERLSSVLRAAYERSSSIDCHATMIFARQLWCWIRNIIAHNSETNSRAVDQV